MLLGFVDAHTSFVILHLLGVALGAGGAFASDAMFFLSAKDRKITTTELKFLHLGGYMVWFGLAVLLVSGTLLFFQNPEQYMESSKFLAKMTIVLVIVANGIVFHRFHLPMLHRLKEESFALSKEFQKKSSLLMASGAVSFVSWVSVIILGALRGIPYPYWAIMGVYGFIVVSAVAIVLVARRRLLLS